MGVAIQPLLINLLSLHIIYLQLLLRHNAHYKSYTSNLIATDLFFWHALEQMITRFQDALHIDLEFCI